MCHVNNFLFFPLSFRKKKPISVRLGLMMIHITGLWSSLSCQVELLFDILLFEKCY